MTGASTKAIAGTGARAASRACDAAGAAALRQHVRREPREGCARLGRIGAERWPRHDQLVEAQVEEIAEPLRARLRGTDDAEALDELGRELARLRRADLGMAGHGVRGVDGRKRVALG